MTRSLLCGCGRQRPSHAGSSEIESRSAKCSSWSTGSSSHNSGYGTCTAVHVPYPLLWELEHVDHDEHFADLDSISGLPTWLGL